MTVNLGKLHVSKLYPGARSRRIRNGWQIVGGGRNLGMAATEDTAWHTAYYLHVQHGNKDDIQKDKPVQ